MRIQHSDFTIGLAHIEAKDGTHFMIRPNSYNKNSDLLQYKEDGWKQLITPSYPNGNRWRHIESFDTFQDALDYLKDWRG